MSSTGSGDALSWRYATKSFDPNRKISEAEFFELSEALRLCPSSFGLQPWKFVIVQNPALREELVQCSGGQRQVADASHLVVLCSLKEITPDHVRKYVEDTAHTRGVARESLKNFEDRMLGFIAKMNPEKVAQWMKDQVYLALGFLMHEAAVRRIDSCPMEGFDAKKYDEVLSLDEKGIRSVVLCPLGYRSPDDKYAQLKKVRFPRENVFVTIA